MSQRFCTYLFWHAYLIYQKSDFNFLFFLIFTFYFLKKKIHKIFHSSNHNRSQLSSFWGGNRLNTKCWWYLLIISLKIMTLNLKKKSACSIRFKISLKLWGIDFFSLINIQGPGSAKYVSLNLLLHTEVLVWFILSFLHPCNPFSNLIQCLLFQ